MQQIRADRRRAIATLCAGVAAASGRVAHAQSVDLRAQNFYPQGPTSAWWVVGEQLFDSMRKATDGRVNVRHFPGGALVQVPDYLPATQRGTIDMFTAFDAMLAGAMPWIEWNTVPGLVGWPDEFLSLLDGGMFDLVDRLVQKRGLKLVSYWGHGDIMLVATRNKEVRALDDLKGLRIRAPGPLYAKAFQAVGASAVSIPPAEVYTSVQTGVVDGVALATYGYTSLKLNEVAPNMTFLGGELVGSGTVGWFMGLDRWNKLPQTDQAAIAKTGREHGRWATQYIKKMNDDILRDARTLGIKTIDVPLATRQSWTKVSQPAVLEMYLERSGADGKTVLALVDEFKKKRR